MPSACTLEPLRRVTRVIRVLYVGAGDLARPTSGLDFATRCHFEELSADPRLTIDAISVSPLPIDGAVSAKFPVRQFASDMLTLGGTRQRLWRKLGLLARGGILFHSGILSDPARRALSAAMARRPDVIVVDNLSALGNVSLIRLLMLRLRGRSRILVIAHDATADVMRDRARLQNSATKAFLLRLHALHCQTYETVVLAIANQVVFLSRTDRRKFALLSKAKTRVLCLLFDSASAPTSEAPNALSQDVSGPYLIFIGSPSFFANAFAIEWIERQFAPRLHQLMPRLRIVLVGKGTDGPAPLRPDTVIGLGFADEAKLHRLLRDSLGLLSPVVHGSGIKIKVIEAIASGAAIFATRSSLRGYEFMELEPVLDIDDPAGSVARVCSIVETPSALAEYRSHIRRQWAAYQSERRGKLADTVFDVSSQR